MADKGDNYCSCGNNVLNIHQVLYHKDQAIETLHIHCSYMALDHPALFRAFIIIQSGVSSTEMKIKPIRNRLNRYNLFLSIVI